MAFALATVVVFRRLELDGAGGRIGDLLRRGIQAEQNGKTGEQKAHVDMDWLGLRLSVAWECLVGKGLLGDTDGNQSSLTPLIRPL